MTTTTTYADSHRATPADEFPFANAESLCSHAYLKGPVEKFLEGTPEGASVLDLGCGNGSFLAGFRDRHWKLHGIDISTSGIRQARAAYPDIAFFPGDLTQDLAPLFGELRFDRIVSTEVVEHVYSPRAFMRNCYGLLKPGGTLVISTPYHGYCKNLVLALAGRMDGHFGPLWDHGHIKFWSRRTLTSLLHEAGFGQVRFAGAGRVPFLWKSMVLQATSTPSV